MISIRKYLDATSQPDTVAPASRKPQPVAGNMASPLVDAYRAILVEMGRSGTDACPATGAGLAHHLGEISQSLTAVDPASLAETSASAHTTLHNWGRHTAQHFQQKAAEVKEMLLAMARTAQSVGDRDQRCARQIDDVTAQLRRIGTLDDISQIRASIEKSATELKSSIDRLNAEGKSVLDALEAKVSSFQARLDEAEQLASLDALTRLRSRLWVECQLEQRVAASSAFSVAILDIDGFKSVNDNYGHIVGDQLLRQFAHELRSACRSSDIVGRWGGDEFLIVLDSHPAEAEAQIDRVRAWVCGPYTMEGKAGILKIEVNASIGLAAFTPPETMEKLLDRADSAMYRNKSASRSAASHPRPDRKSS